VSRPSSVGFRLISLASWILLPAIVAIVFLIWQFSEDRFRAERASMVGNTRALAAAVDAEVQRHLVAASILAFARQDGSGTIAEFYQFAIAALRHLPNSWVVLVDAGGQQLINTSVPLGNALPTLLQFELHERAMRQGGYLISDVVMGQSAQKPVVGVLVPVTRAGRPVEDVIVAINTDKMGEIMRSNELPEGWLNGVIDRNGNFVARNIDHARLVGQPASEGWRKAAKERPEGFFVTTSLEGETVYTYFINSPLTGWSIAVGAPRSALWAPILRSIWQMAAFVAGLIALSVILALWVGRRIAAPMNSLEQAAVALIHGEKLSLSRTGVREVDQAFDAFEISAAELLERDRRQQILVGELGHRIKNILAIIQATARLSSYPAENLTDYLQKFEQRLMGISRTHDLLLQGSWKGAQLKDIIMGELSVFEAELAQRVKVSGPPVEFPPSLTWSMNLVAHELATNAAKYGALSLPEGVIDVSWALETTADGERLTLHWRERGGPAVRPPTRTGFGSTLVKRIIESELSGRAQFEYPVDGFKCTLEFLKPASAVAEENAGAMRDPVTQHAGTQAEKTP
jgi:two-component sensor histidine kinase